MSGKKKQLITDDELLGACIKENGQCHASNCSKSIKVIAMQCGLCRDSFCPTHQLPEEHGCGQAARKMAAKSSTQPRPASNAQKSGDLHGKMSKKLEQMKNDRKKKSK